MILISNGGFPSKADAKFETFNILPLVKVDKDTYPGAASVAGHGSRVAPGKDDGTTLSTQSQTD